MGDKETMQIGRQFMQGRAFYEMMSQSDQAKGLPNPPLGNEITGEITELPSFETVVTQPDYTTLLDTRRSERVYNDVPMSQEQLAFMLWSIQGVQMYRAANRIAVLRPVPSGGARHAFELYAAVRSVQGLRPGLYRYAPLQNVGEKRVSLEFIKPLEDHAASITAMLSGQSFAAKAAVVLFLSCVPYRCEWRYASASHRLMLMDAGHVGQNAMLSATALGLGSCCFAAFDQDVCDQTIGLDGTNEFTLYAVSVGECPKVS
ncbi:MAG: SagB/ThcOx family dehydrogenase [Defluviitaleaceae bacterium]|nr:SagB/ThcOx family dehydrogenase [Defluviitaleaceae bacterium]